MSGSGTIVMVSEVHWIITRQAYHDPAWQYARSRQTGNVPPEGAPQPVPPSAEIIVRTGEQLAT
jgi:hypothetical protein